MKQTRKLLLVAHTFPPEISAGAVRPGYLARYLPEFGWDVTTLTHSVEVPPFPARVISASSPASRVIDMLPFRLRNAFLSPDATAGWIPAAVSKGKTLLALERFDAILSTAHPPAVHMVGSKLAAVSDLPWVADYRDLWAGNPYIKRHSLRAKYDEWLERTVLSRASRITTISEPIARDLARFHGRDNVAVIPNAYDPSDWEAVASRPPQGFDLVFTGSMHSGIRNPDLLFSAIRDLGALDEEAGEQANVHFYGPNNESVDTSAARYGITSQVHRHRAVPRAQVMQVQRSAAVLVIFLSMDPSTSTEMGSKYLEYVGARRPIIAFGPADSVMREFIVRNRLGWFASNREEAKQALREAYETYRAGSPQVEADCQNVPTARAMAARFAQVLDDSRVVIRLEAAAAI